jgi:hypothetical protein
MTFRLWYPQLDVYDTARRMTLLLGHWKHAWPVLERLCILDFYLANPPLLHHTRMPDAVRRDFRDIAVARPEKTFLSYPSAPLLFAKMEPVQKEAFRTLMGKGLLDRGEFDRTGRVSPSAEGEALFAGIVANLVGDTEVRIINFLSGVFGMIGEDQPGGLRNATTLWRPGL